MDTISLSLYVYTYILLISLSLVLLLSFLFFILLLLLLYYFEVIYDSYSQQPRALGGPAAEAPRLPGHHLDDRGYHYYNEKNTILLGIISITRKTLKTLNP